MSETFVFHAATLDDPGALKPQMVVHSTAAQPSDPVDAELPRK